MKPELEGFFSSMAELFAEPRHAEQVHARQGRGAPPLERLRLYGRFVEGHVHSTLKKIFPSTRAALGARFEPLAAEYYRLRPATHYELNRAAEGFVAFLADRASREHLPAHVPAMARFEWTDFATYAAELDVPRQVDAPAVNPTLTVLQHPYALTRFFALAPPQRPPTPAAADEIALLWRHPRSHLTTFVAADPVRLLALKLVLEAIAPERAAAETGVDVETLSAALRQGADEGFLLLPAPGAQR